jgi:radical SAM superfamily enzyme YgiQ (UPF0313 family)
VIVGGTTMEILMTSLNTKYVHSNLAIRYIREYCKSLPVKIRIEEYTINQHEDDIVGEIFRKELDVICFSVYIWNLEQTLRVAEMIKTLRSDITIVLGGPEVTYDSRACLEKNQYIDIIIRGEGEATARDLFNTLEQGLDLEEVYGITFRSEGKIFENPDRELIKNLDDIPFPYTESELLNFQNKIVYYESSRGCPFNCAFCLSSTIRGLRYFSLDRAKSDLKKLLEAKVKQIKFVDRTFNASKNHAKEIMEFIIENDNRHTNVHFEITAHLVDQEFLDILSKAPVGLFQFEIGVQTTHPETIKAIHRTTNFEQLAETVRKIDEIGNSHQHLDLIAGLPYEDYETFGKSFDDVYNLKPDKIQLGFLKLLKGSSLRLNADTHEYKFSNYPVYEVFENKYMSFKEFRQLKTIEDLVEKYGNERRFFHSLEFLIKHYDMRPFKLFEEFAIYWESKDYHNCQHGLKTLYNLLLEFYEFKFSEHADLFRELLKFDYMKSQNGKLLYEGAIDKSFNQAKHNFLQNDEYRAKYLPEYENIPAKKLVNQVTIEKFKYDILGLIETDYKEINIKDPIYLFSKEGGYLKYEICLVQRINEEFLQ